MEKTLEELYKTIMKDYTSSHDNQNQNQDTDRFKSILHPDYSDYSTSAITGNIC